MQYEGIQMPAQDGDGTCSQFLADIRLRTLHAKSNRSNMLRSTKYNIDRLGVLPVGQQPSDHLPKETEIINSAVQVI